MMRDKILLTIILAFLISLFSCEKETERDELKVEFKTPVKGKVETNHKLFSNALNRNMNYSIYFPPGYDTTTVDYPVLYLLHGMWGNYLDWVNNGMENIVNLALSNDAAVPMIVVMPDGLDAFYCNNYDGGPLQYEDFFVDEFIPHIESTYRIKSTRKNRAIAGLSMGGYGTTFHAFKRPEMFSAAYSMSGAMLGTAAPDLRQFVEGKSEEELAQMPKFTMECGTEDFLVYQANEDFDLFLNEHGMDHDYIARPGGHDWNFWKACLPNALKLASEQFE